MKYKIGDYFLNKERKLIYQIIDVLDRCSFPECSFPNQLTFKVKVYSLSTSEIYEDYEHADDFSISNFIKISRNKVMVELL